MKLSPDLHAYVWTTLAAGIASSPLRHRIAADIAKEADALLAEYEKRRAERYPEPPSREGFGDGR